MLLAHSQPQASAAAGRPWSERCMPCQAPCGGTSWRPSTWPCRPGRCAAGALPGSSCPARRRRRRTGRPPSLPEEARRVTASLQMQKLVCYMHLVQGGSHTWRQRGVVIDRGDLLRARQEGGCLRMAPRLRALGRLARSALGSCCSPPAAAGRPWLRRLAKPQRSIVKWNADGQSAASSSTPSEQGLMGAKPVAVEGYRRGGLPQQ